LAVIDQLQASVERALESSHRVTPGGLVDIRLSSQRSL
jgi:hypothetical protein